MVVTKRWRGMRWTQAVSKTSDTDADGKAVWSWRPTLASSPVEFIHKATVANKPDHRGERGISRKPLCRGCPGASAEPVCSCAPLLPLRMRPRVQRAPGIPCALWLMEGQVFEQNSDATYRENAHGRHCEERQRRSNPCLRLPRHGLLRGARNDRNNPPPSFRGAPLGANPESIQPRILRPNGFQVRAIARPGMTKERNLRQAVHPGMTTERAAPTGASGNDEAKVAATA